jgi:hypothetical protein
MKKRFRREGLICRADGDSKIYEASHRERLKVLQENHDKHFSGMAVGFLAPKTDPFGSEQTRYTIRVFGKEKVVDKQTYDIYNRTFKK